MALIFASCDDRGSTPSGGSELSATILLTPNRADYPSSGWQVMFKGTNTEAGDSMYATASSIQYTPAEDGGSALLLVKGIPSKKGYVLDSTAYVMFTSEIAGAQMGVATLIPTVSGVTQGSVASFESAAPATIKLTVNAPSTASLDGALALPTSASSYPLTLTAGDISETIVPTAVKVTAASDPAAKGSKAVTPASAALTYSASYSPADGVTLPIGILSGTTSFTGTLSMAIGETPAGLPNYTASIGSVDLSAGATASPSATLAQLSYGSVVVALPESLTAATANDANPAFAYTSVSYSLTADGKSVAKGEATVGKSDAGAPQFSIPNILAGGNYTLSVSLTAPVKDIGDVTYSASSVQVNAPSVGEDGKVQSGSATVQQFYAQLGTLSVTLQDGPNAALYLTSPSAYEISYVSSAEGASPVSVAVTPEMVAKMAAGQAFAIESVPAGASYTVSVARLSTEFATYGGKSAAPVELSAVTSSSPSTAAITVPLKVISGNDPAPLSGVNAAGTINGGASKFSGISGTVTEGTLTVTNPSGVTGSVTASVTATSGNITFSGSNFSGIAQAFAGAFSVSGTITTDSGTYNVTGTAKGTLENTTFTFNEISGTAEPQPEQVTVTLEGSSIDPTGNTTQGNLVLNTVPTSLTGVSGSVSDIIDSVSITIDVKEASGSDSSVTSATVTLKEGKTLNDLKGMTAMVWTGVNAQLGGSGATYKDVTLTGTSYSGSENWSLSSITFTT